MNESVITASINTIIIIAGYISYKFPAIKKNGKPTVHLKIYKIIGGITILFTWGLVYISDKNTKNFDKNIQTVFNKIDSIGYKLDIKSGKLVIKNTSIQTYNNSIKAENYVSQINKNGSNKYALINGNGNIDQSDTYTGISQRHITNELLSKIVSKIPNKNLLINIFIFPGDRESLIFSNEVFSALQKMGYLKIKLENYFSGVPEDKNNDVECIIEADGTVSINIYPSNNVQLSRE